MRRAASFWGSAVYGAGLVLAFVGERVVAVGSGRGVLTGLGLALVLAAAVWRAGRQRAGDAERTWVERVLLVLVLVGVAALVLYLLQSDLFARVAKVPLDRSAPKLAGILAALWPAGIAFGVLPTLLVELAYASMARAPRLEVGRVRDALLSGLGLASVLVLAFAAFYVADARDAHVDLSYFRTGRPGQSTRNVIRALTDPLEVALFFPPHNDVEDAVAGYFQDLARLNPQLKVEVLDQAVDPARAKELGVTTNGSVVIHRGARKERLFFPLDFEQAKPKLSTLDPDAQKAILTVARNRRTYYFTAGHGERTETNVMAVDRRPTLRLFRDMIRSQNADVKDLTAADGLATEIPKDAAAVLVVGPTTDFMPEEIATLRRYAENGGHVLLALDPEAGLSFSGLVAPWGVTFVPTTLCNDRYFLPRNHEASDHAILATSSFSSHPAVTTLSQLSGKVGLIFLGAGYLETQKTKPPFVAVDDTLKSQADSWNDVNGNFLFDGPPEVRKSYAIGAAVNLRKGKQEGRAVVVADSDLLTDLVFENPGNSYFAMDTIKWLSGDEATAGTVDNETDVPLEHTRGQDVVWFYSTVFLVPAAVLVAGFAVNRRKRRRA